MKSRLLLRFAVAIVLALCPAMHARAEGPALVAVSPTRVDLSPSQRSGMLTLRNNGAETVRYQISAFAWGLGPRGEMQLTPTKDVAFFPSLFELPPGASRTIRVGVAGGAGTKTELTYRLIVEQLPPPQTQASGAVLRVLTNLSIPVFFAPPDTHADARVEKIEARPGKLTFELRNAGTRSLRATTLQVKALDGWRQTIFEQAIPGWYVLADGTRLFELELPPDACTRMASVEIELALPDGAPVKARQITTCAQQATR